VLNDTAMLVGPHFAFNGDLSPRDDRREEGLRADDEDEVLGLALEPASPRRLALTRVARLWGEKSAGGDGV